jgi:HAE1 family hydrophobic/amphiphilic exporter-1
MNLSDYSLKRPVTIVVATLAIMVLGLVSLPRLKLDFLPKMELPFIAVWMPYPNSIPSQVEKDVVRPVEETMATLGGVQQMRSFSDQDGAWVMVEFEFGKSVSVLRLEVQEKMEQVRSLLPDDLRDYFIFTFDSNDIPIIVGRISATGRDLSQEYDLLERRTFDFLLSRAEIMEVAADTDVIAE